MDLVSVGHVALPLPLSAFTVLLAWPLPHLRHGSCGVPWSLGSWGWACCGFHSPGWPCVRLVPASPDWPWAGVSLHWGSRSPPGGLPVLGSSRLSLNARGHWSRSPGWEQLSPLGMGGGVGRPNWPRDSPSRLINIRASRWVAVEWATDIPPTHTHTYFAC